jgi:hypothetical protein
MIVVIQRATWWKGGSGFLVLPCLSDDGRAVRGPVVST